MADAKSDFEFQVELDDDPTLDLDVAVSNFTDEKITEILGIEGLSVEGSSADIRKRFKQYLRNRRKTLYDPLSTGSTATDKSTAASSNLFLQLPHDPNAVSRSEVTTTQQTTVATATTATSVVHSPVIVTTTALGFSDRNLVPITTSVSLEEQNKLALQNSVAIMQQNFVPTSTNAPLITAPGALPPPPGCQTFTTPSCHGMQMPLNSFSQTQGVISNPPPPTTQYSLPTPYSNPYANPYPNPYVNSLYNNPYANPYANPYTYGAVQPPQAFQGYPPYSFNQYGMQPQPQTFIPNSHPYVYPHAQNYLGDSRTSGATSFGLHQDSLIPTAVQQPAAAISTQQSHPHISPVLTSSQANIPLQFGHPGVPPPGSSRTGSGPDSPNPYRPLRNSLRQQRSDIDLRRNFHIMGALEKLKITFSGTVGQDPSRFVAQLDEAAVQLDLSDDDLFKNMTSILSGEACEWFRLERRNWQTYDQFVIALINQYSTVNFQERLLEEARNRTQHKDETIISFCTALRMIFDKVTPPLPLERQLDIAYNNLHPSYLKDIIRYHFNTFEQLQDIGKQVELKILRLRQYKPPPAPEDSLVPSAAFQPKKASNPSTNSKRDNSGKTAAVRETTNNNTKTSSNNSNQPKPQTNNRQNNSGKPRPSAQTTSSAPKKENSDNAVRQPRKTNPNIICRKCGEKGHIVMHCPTRINGIPVCFSCGKEGAKAPDCPCIKGSQKGNANGGQQ